VLLLVVAVGTAKRLHGPSLVFYVRLFASLVRGPRPVYPTRPLVLAPCTLLALSSRRPSFRVPILAIPISQPSALLIVVYDADEDRPRSQALVSLANRPRPH